MTKDLAFANVTVGPARSFDRPFRVQRLTFDRSFSGTLTAASQFVSLSLRSRAAAYSRAGARNSYDQAGARVRARLVLVNQFELRGD